MHKIKEDLILVVGDGACKELKPVKLLRHMADGQRSLVLDESTGVVCVETHRLLTVDDINQMMEIDPDIWFEKVFDETGLEPVGEAPKKLESIKDIRFCFEPEPCSYTICKHGVNQKATKLTYCDLVWNDVDEY